MQLYTTKSVLIKRICSGKCTKCGRKKKIILSRNVVLSFDPSPYNDDLTHWRKRPFENIVGKKENAGNQHFLLFPRFLPLSKQISIFQPHLFCRLQMLSIWTSLQFCHLVKNLTLSQTSPVFYMSRIQVFWKHYGKRRNCSWWAIFPFPTVFSTHLENFLPSSSNFRLQTRSVWEHLKCCLVKS